MSSRLIVTLRDIKNMARHLYMAQLSLNSLNLIQEIEKQIQSNQEVIKSNQEKFAKQSIDTGVKKVHTKVTVNN